MTMLIQYSGPDARHGAGVDVGYDNIHLDLDGDAVEVPDALGKALLKEQPKAFKSPAKKAAPKKDTDGPAVTTKENIK